MKRLLSRISQLVEPRLTNSEGSSSEIGLSPEKRFVALTNRVRLQVKLTPEKHSVLGIDGRTKKRRNQSIGRCLVAGDRTGDTCLPQEDNIAGKLRRKEALKLSRKFYNWSFSVREYCTRFSMS